MEEMRCKVSGKVDRMMKPVKQNSRIQRWRCLAWLSETSEVPFYSLETSTGLLQMVIKCPGMICQGPSGWSCRGWQDRVTERFPLWKIEALCIGLDGSQSQVTWKGQCTALTSEPTRSAHKVVMWEIQIAPTSMASCWPWCGQQNMS